MWCSLALTGIAVSLLSRDATSVSILAGIDDYILALATVLISRAALVNMMRHPIERRIEYLGRITTFMSLLVSMNSLICIAQYLDADFDGVLPYFWTGTWGEESQSGKTVAQNSLTMSRFTGIFNQPVEWGIVCSAVMYLWARLSEYKAFSVRDFLLILLTAVGGVLGNSKVFLFVAIPTTLALLNTVAATRSTRRATILACAITIAGLAFSLLFRNDEGSVGALVSLNNQMDFIAKSDDILFGITGGRLSWSGSAIFDEQLSYLWYEGGLWGIGFGGVAAVDSAFIHSFMSAGVLGLVLYMAMLFTLLIPWITLREGGNQIAGAVYGGYVGLIILSSLGAPALLLNRAGPICLMTLCVLHSSLSLGTARQARGSVLPVHSRRAK
jgi:hypothetical protein